MPERRGDERSALSDGHVTVVESGQFGMLRIEMSTAWKDHVESNPNVLRGKPHIKGTRIPVGLILGYLAAGCSSEQIIGEFPDLNPEQIAACLDYARDLAEFEVAV
jgi:uncharacterized protein (DUF433 family)